jgi:eukaryotic-like serine/threonine-protein kinase
MTACPSHELIAALLAERLPEPELSGIVAHIEICLRCQTHLDGITRGPGRLSTLQDVIGEGKSVDQADGSTALNHDATPPAMAEGGADEDDSSVGSTACLTDLAVDATRDRTHPEIDLLVAVSRVEPDAAPSDFPEIPGYEIIERLGHGGMGVVYKARDVGLDRLVALKMIRGGSQAKPEFFKRFSTEAAVVAKLHHAHILQIYDIGESGGLPFVALELLEGGGLDDRLAGTPHPGGFAAELLITLAGAVQVAHEAGIIHRDLKPSNVLFTVGGVPKITDFGLAKRIDSEENQTESGQVMGSPSYMAPEQARGHSKQVGAAADVYALGAIFYEMLTGRPPFKGETPIETIRQVIADDPVPPSRLVPRLPRDLETICLKCLNKDPARRFESAEALALDLGRYLRKEPIHARPTPPWERAAKWARRHPLSVAAGIMAALLLFGGSTGGFLYERALRMSSLRYQTRSLIAMGNADAARSPSELQQADRELSGLFSVIEREGRLTTLTRQIADKRKRVGDQLDRLQSEQATRERRQVDRERLSAFRKLRRQAQLYAVRLSAVQAAEHQASIRDTAAAALSIYAQDRHATASSWSLSQPLPEALEPAEKEEVKAGCFDLLAILSDSVEPAEGLKILDCARRLRGELTAAYHLRRAAILFQSGDTTGRAREEQLAHALRPTTALDHLLICREQIARAQFREAIHSAQSAIRLDPDQLGAHLLLAVAYFNTQAFSEARIVLNSCIQTAPDLLGLYLFRARVLGEIGNHALLKIEQTPSLAAVCQLEAAESMSAALNDYRLVLDQNPSPQLLYVLLVNRGGMYLEDGRLDQAIADAEAAVKLNGKPYHAHALLAQILEKKGRHGDAALALGRAIERQPDRPELFRARAMLVARQHSVTPGKPTAVTPAQRAMAIRDLDQAIRLQPDDTPQKADDHAELGRLFFASGQTPEAMSAYDKALRMFPDSLKALRLRTLALLEQERFDEVLAACDAFLAKGKPSADLLEIRGQARLARKNWSGAIGDYAVALSMNPDSAPLHNRRGWAYLLTDAYKLALADFDDALLLDHELGHAYSGRGLAKVSLGRWRDALIDVEAAVRLATTGLKQQALYNAARVNALAARYASEEVSRRGEAGLNLYRQLRERARALLRESVHQLPPEKQAPFWRDVVASDPVLRPLIP